MGKFLLGAACGLSAGLVFMSYFRPVTYVSTIYDGGEMTSEDILGLPPDEYPGPVELTKSDWNTLIGLDFPVPDDVD